jgi:hypothetical protein
MKEIKTSITNLIFSTPEQQWKLHCHCEGTVQSTMVFTSLGEQ